MAEGRDVALDQVTTRRVKTLKLSRRGKKSAITKRINELEKLVVERGSRRRIQFLSDKLLKVFEDLNKVCTEISELCDEIDDHNDLADVEAKIDSCVALITEYLGTRQDEPSSSGSFCSTWVKQHAVGMFDYVSHDGSRSNSTTTGVKLNWSLQ